jgi:hypothetical protein
MARKIRVQPLQKRNLRSHAAIKSLYKNTRKITHVLRDALMMPSLLDAFHVLWISKFVTGAGMT